MTFFKSIGVKQILALLFTLLGVIVSPLLLNSGSYVFDKNIASKYRVVGSIDIGTQPFREIAVDPRTNNVYISGSFAQNGLTVINTSKPGNPKISALVQSGGGVAVNPKTDRYYTSDGYGGDILVYDGRNNTLIDEKKLGFCGGDLTVDSARNLVYIISQCGSNNDPVFVLDGRNDNIVAGPLGSGGVASHILENPASGLIYASNWRFDGGNPYTRIFKPTQYLDVQDYFGQTRAINPKTNRIYEEQYGILPNKVLVLNGKTNTQIGVIQNAGVNGQSTTFGIDINRDRIYIPDPANKNIKVVDGGTNLVIGNFTLGAGVVPSGAIAVDSIKHQIYIVGSDNGINKLYIVQNKIV